MIWPTLRVLDLVLGSPRALVPAFGTALLGLLALYVHAAKVAGGRFPWRLSLPVSLG
jgi:hypothetical protein